MKKILTICSLLLCLKMVPMKTTARVHSAALSQPQFPSGGYSTLVTAGIAGVAASAGLLLLSNRWGS